MMVKSKYENNTFRSSHRRFSVRKVVLRNCPGKHLCQSLFLIKLQAEDLYTAMLRRNTMTFFKLTGMTV